MHYYEVAPVIISRKDSPTYTYCSLEPLAIGTIVHISIGKKTTHGIVVKETSQPPYDTKAIISSHAFGPLPLPLLSTALWMSEYYATPLATVLQAVLPRGLDIARRTQKTSVYSSIRKRTNFVFTADQRAAIDTVNSIEHGSALLHGVTGSGKTAVYIELAKQALEAGRSSIILVPEIALTSQLVDEFSHHFPNIIITHSSQTEALRHVQWLDALNSEKPRVVIGPRSAVFMPLSNIGLIVVDESHEPTYRQDTTPRYYIPRVASVLGNFHRAKVLYGSATPPVSEYYLASSHKKPIISMSRAMRAVSPPTVEIVDMTARQHFRNHPFFSNALLSAIRTSRDNGHQTLIFHNRRGSASTTLCENCGWIDACDRCALPRALHGDHHYLRCHVCGNTAPVPTTCPSCNSADILHKGIGTKRIESELKKLFPDASIARYDGDTLSHETLDKQYALLYNGDIDIIIGTQVVAKGLDLPLLDTVGIVQADTGINLPDFIASERTFQLISQVAGRIGRSSIPSRLIIQSFQPHHPAVVYGASQNYEAFYKETVAQRRRNLYPPFTYLLKLTCSYKTEHTAIQHATVLASHLTSKYPSEISVFGPTPAFYERQRDHYRWQIIVKSPQRSTLLAIINSDLAGGRWQVDLDPLGLL